jgi:hypothetical protein
MMNVAAFSNLLLLGDGAGRRQDLTAALYLTPD